MTLPWQPNLSFQPTRRLKHAFGEQASGDAMRMSRRVFVAGSTALMLASPKGAEAQEGKKGSRIALVLANAPEAEIIGPNPRNAGVRVFLEQMRELGWVDGQNITIERRSTEGKPERLATLAEELLGLRVELVVLSAGREPILTVKQAIGSTPLIWLGVNPDWLVQVGLAKSLARPGGTVTGLTSRTGPELLGKQLQLLKEAIPRVSRVAYLTTTLPVPSEAEIAGRALSLRLGGHFPSRPRVCRQDPQGRQARGPSHRAAD